MKTNQPIRQNAFTLIELLVVITIISIIAAMVLTAGKNASLSKKRTVVQAQRQKIMSMIEEYKAALNYYPPDNGLLATTNAQYYDFCASVNPLLYELTGVTNVNQDMIVFNSTANSATFIPRTTFSSLFNRGGVANGDSEQPHDFYIPPPQATDYAAYPKTGGPGVGNNQLYGLVVPIDVVPNSAAPNFWHYDSSSPQRHNPNSYDLWAEYEVGNKNGSLLILTNGNW